MDVTKLNFTRAVVPTSLEHSYSNNITNKRIVILGPLPPPIGGISMHIKRVTQKFISQNNLVYNFDTIHCILRYPLCLIHLSFFLIHKWPHFVYYHTLYGHGLFELRIILLIKKIVKFQLSIIDHDCRYLYSRSDSFKKKYQKFLKNVDQLILIGSTTAASYADAKIDLPKKTTTESPFIPPNTHEEGIILKEYPESTFVFLTNKTPLILMNAFQLTLIDNKDLYGINLAIDALHILKKTFANIGLLLVVAQVGNIPYYKTLIKIIEEKNLGENCFFLFGNKELWPLLRRVNVFIRPTISDSYGISIAEACYFGIPAIASDCCLRPQGTLLFKNDDLDDLIMKILHVLK